MPACSRPGCERDGVRKHGHHAMYCEMHYRLVHMRSSANRSGKIVPDMDALEAMVPDPLVCQTCEMEMFWCSDTKGEVVSLQHWKNGTISLVCHTCNARMNMRDELSPEGQRWCPRCERNLPYESNFRPRQASGRFPPYCAECDRQYQRERRATIKKT